MAASGQQASTSVAKLGREGLRLLELAYSRERNLHIEDGHFKEQSKVYDIILNSPMRGSKFFL